MGIRLPIPRLAAPQLGFGGALVAFLLGAVLFTAPNSAIGQTTEPPSSAEATTQLEIEPGSRISEIRVLGARRTKEYIILRELVSEVGDLYRPELLEDGRARLDRLDIFSSIELTATAGDAGVVLQVEVQETFPWLPSVSVSITDDNGVAFGPQVKNNNFLGRNIFLAGRLQFGGVTNTEAQINNPWFAGNHLSYKLQLAHRERESPNVGFFETSNEANLELQSWLGRTGRIGGRFNLLDVGSDIDGVTLDRNRQDQVVELAGFVGIDSRDLVSDTGTGWWNELEIRRSGVFSAGDSNHWQLTLDARRYFSLADRHTVALFSMGRLRSGDVGSEVAPWQLFYIGGTNSVRGWQSGSRSGKNEWISTLEYRFTFLEPRPIRLPFNIDYRGGLHVAAFVDVGVAWSKKHELGWKNTIAGYGLGLRVLVPIVGMIRLDLGLGGEPGGQLQLHFGAAEKPVATRMRLR